MGKRLTNDQLRDLVQAKNTLLKIAIRQLGGVLRIPADEPAPVGKIKLMRDDKGNASFFLVERDEKGTPVIYFGKPKV